MKVRFDEHAGGPDNAARSRGLPVDYPPGQRPISVWRWNLVVLVLLAPMLYFLGRWLLDQWWISAPAAVRLPQSTLRASQDGQVARVASIGTRVPAGASLVEFMAPRRPVTSPPLVTRRAGRPQEARSYGRLIAYWRQRVASYRRLMRDGAGTQAELAAALSHLQELELARQRLAEDIATPPPGQPVIEALPPLAAPFPGIVSERHVNVGERVAAGTPLVTLLDDSRAEIVAYLDPRHARYAQPGRRGRLEFRDGTVLRARVVGVLPETAPLPGQSAAPLEASLEYLQVILAAEDSLPALDRTQHLPLVVRFDTLPLWK